MVTKQKNGSTSRWGLACLLAATVASTPASVLAACSAPAPFAVFYVAPDVELDLELEVLVSPEIVDAAELQQWIHDEGLRVLDELPDEPGRRGSLHVELGGALYDYRVTITTLRDGAVLGTPTTWVCECSNEELLEKLRAGLPELTAVLEVEEEAEQEVEPVVTSPVVPDDGEAPRRGRLGPAGVAGVALMTVGATGVGAGVVLMALNERRMPYSDHHLGEARNRDFISSGKLAAIGGGGVLLTGVLLYIFRKRIDRGEVRRFGMLAPTFDARGQAHLTITGRF